MSLRRLVAFALALGSLAPGAPARAEVDGVKLTISPYVGFALWDQLVKLDESPVFGGRLGLWFGSRIGLEGTYGYSSTETTGQIITNDFTHIGGDLVVNLTRGNRVVPYLTGGWSQQIFDPTWSTDAAVGKKQTFDGWEAGAGFRVELYDRVHLRVDLRDVFAEIDPPLSREKQWIHDFIFSFGLDFTLGGHVADEDRDGVSNRKDRCPATPLGAVVDVNGCPIDGDADGVPDGIDQCANTAVGAKVDARGCPIDGDGDGVADGVDQCPSTPMGSRVDARGCPLDGDADGVPDGIDQCQNTPSGARVDARGCPLDSDRDGVPDGIDQCANTAAGLRVDARGCPIEVSEKETQLLDTGMIRLSNVNFATGKSEIQASSFAALDEVGRILEQWPQLQIEVGGHTDSRGSAQMNQRLSESRAQAVLDYLRNRFPGLSASQYTARGYGEGKPIADNKTDAGRSQNRRVEFKVLNTETLRKEIEKRKLLKKD